MIRILVTIFAGLLGLAFGSFLNVFVTRWPEGESVVKPRSHCRNCEHTLVWWENIPLLSWIFLRGRCCQCKSWISWRYPLVEFVVAGLWAEIGWRSWSAFFPIEFAIGMMLFTWILVSLAVLDFENLWLPDLLTLPGVALGFLWWFIQGLQIGWALHVPAETWDDAERAGKRILGILVAAGLILLIRWLYWLVRKQEGIGLGDAKLMAMLAAWLGLPLALLAFAMSAVLGSIAAFALLAVPDVRSGEKNWATSKLPFGTFICISGIISSLWGERIVAAYLHFAGF